MTNIIYQYVYLIILDAKSNCIIRFIRFVFGVNHITWYFFESFVDLFVGIFTSSNTNLLSQRTPKGPYFAHPFFAFGFWFLNPDTLPSIFSPSAKFVVFIVWEIFYAEIVVIIEVIVIVVITIFSYVYNRANELLIIRIIPKYNSWK